MANTLHPYFSASDLNRIESAVKKAESGTAGEIAVVLATHSSGALRQGWLPAALVGLVAGVVALLSASGSGWGATYDYSLATLCGISAFVVTHLAIRTWSKRNAASAVWGRALEHFQHLSPTRARTAVLLYVSLSERQVAVIADAGIAGHVASNYWDATRDFILEGFRTGRQMEHLLAAIDKLGASLALHFPRSADDTNELPDRPLVT